MLIFPINTFCQNINSYNIDAKLNSEDNTVTINQVMKFKNTSTTSLNKIVLEDWANSYTLANKDLPLISKSGLFGRRDDPALAGTIITNSSAI